MTEKKYKCDHCGSIFSEFTIDPNDDWDFDRIIQYDGIVCKACIYEMLFKYYREKVWKMEDFIEEW